MTHVLNNVTPEEISQWSTAQREPAWLTAQRTEAWAAYQQLPPPLTTDEAWKYTKLERLAGWDETVWASDETSAVSAELTNTEGSPTSVICTDLKSALKDHAALIAPYLTAATPHSASPRRLFSGSGTRPYGGARYVQQQEALWDQGHFIYVPEGITVTAPMHSIVTCRADGVALFPRSIVVLEAGASLIFVDEFQVPLGAGSDVITSCHARAELYLGEGSSLQHITIQRWPNTYRHIHQQHATVARDARLTTTTINLGARVVKSVSEAALTGPGAEARLYGLSFGDGEQQFDHHTLQTHLAPNTMSDLLYKVALKDQSISTFTGLIKMGKAAQQGSAYQSNRNLLLSQGTRANAIPQLEIDANDVKCSHGATVGRVDQEQLYYLTTRGLPRPEAEKTLVHGFFEDVLARLPDTQVDAIVRQAIAEKLGAA